MYAVNDCVADANAKYAASVAAAIAAKLPPPPPPDLAVLCTPNYAELNPTKTPNWEGPNPYDSLSTAQVCFPVSLRHRTASSCSSSLLNVSRSHLRINTQ